MFLLVTVSFVLSLLPLLLPPPAAGKTPWDLGIAIESFHFPQTEEVRAKELEAVAAAVMEGPPPACHFQCTAGFSNFYMDGSRYSTCTTELSDVRICGVTHFAWTSEPFLYLLVCCFFFFGHFDQLWCLAWIQKGPDDRDSSISECI